MRISRPAVACVRRRHRQFVPRAGVGPLAAVVVGAVALATAGAATTVGAQATGQSTFDAARELADRITDQTRGGGAAKTAEPAEPLPKVDPCSLLSQADVRRFFPAASTGRRERTREKYGIVACLWEYPQGRLVVQVTLGARPGSSMEEAQGIAFGFVDPLKPPKPGAIRYERIGGVGDEAVAVVEKADAKTGVLQNASYLYTQRVDRQLFIGTSELANGDRAAALKTLTELGRLAVPRL